MHCVQINRNRSSNRSSMCEKYQCQQRKNGYRPICVREIFNGDNSSAPAPKEVAPDPPASDTSRSRKKRRALSILNRLDSKNQTTALQKALEDSRENNVSLEVALEDSKEKNVSLENAIKAREDKLENAEKKLKSTQKALTRSKLIKKPSVEGDLNLLHLHLLGSGHILFFLRKYRCLYIFSQLGWEALNAVCTAYILQNSSRGGYGSGQNKTKSYMFPLIGYLMRDLLWKTGIADNFFLEQES